MERKNPRKFLLISTRLALPAGVFIAWAALAQQAPDASIYQRFAPVNVTGNWVSVVTEDWPIRMIQAPKGDFDGLPLNAAGRSAGNAADPAKDAAAGEACKAFAAPELLRMPGRLKVSWQEGGNTLKLEADAGQQTRLLRFTGVEPQVEAGWQGYSVASWEYSGGFNPAVALAVSNAPAAAGGPGRGPAGGGRGGGRGGRGRGGPAGPSGALKVVTTHLKPGYLRTNGVPFSKDTVLTEYFNVYADPYGTDWMIVTTVVHDPAYLASDYITSTNFKREPDDSRWHPHPCAAQ
jgi:hypothetical protein